MIGNDQLAPGIDTEPGDLQRSLRQFAMPGHLTAVVAESPNPPGGPVAIDVGVLQFRERLSAINDAAGQRAHLRMMMVGDGFGEWLGAGLPVAIELVRALQHTPAVIRPALDAIDLFP